MACLSQVFTVSCVGVLQLKEVQSMSKSSPRLTYVATDDGLWTILADSHCQTWSLWCSHNATHMLLCMLVCIGSVQTVLSTIHLLISCCHHVWWTYKCQKMYQLYEAGKAVSALKAPLHWNSACVNFAVAVNNTSHVKGEGKRYYFATYFCRYTPSKYISNIFVDGLCFTSCCSPLDR